MQKINGRGHLNHLAPEGIRAISAGSEPTTKVDPLALAALKEIVIQTNTLNPRLLTREIAQRADKIVTMGCPETCPAVGGPMEDWGIEDPPSEDIDVYRKVRDIITQKVKTLLETLAARLNTWQQ